MSKTKKKTSVPTSRISRKKSNTPSNGAWFKARLESRGLSARQFAKTIKVDQSILSKIMNGTRQLSFDIAASISKGLEIPLEEVLQLSGLDVPEVVSHRSLTIEGWLDGDMIAHWEAPKGPRTAPCHFPEKDIQVLRFQTAGSKFDMFDGALVYFKPSNKVIPDSIGKLCLVRIVGQKETRLRAVRKGYGSDKYNLTAMNGELMEENVAIESTSPVVWLKT